MMILTVKFNLGLVQQHSANVHGHNNVTGHSSIYSEIQGQSSDSEAETLKANLTLSKMLLVSISYRQAE